MMVTVNLTDPRSFNRSLTIALIVHIILGIVIYFFTNYSPSITKSSENEIYLNAAVRVDLVAMPTLTQQEIKDLPLLDTGGAQAAPAVEEVQEEPIKKVDLSNLLNDFSQRKKTPPKTPPAKEAREEKLDKKQMAKLKGLLLEGNKVSEGTSKLGDSKEINMSEYNNYVARLPSFVRPNWSLPTYLMQDGLKCRVRIFISKTGKILNKEIYQSSGNQEFDQRALRALEATNTLPRPDESIQSRLLSGSVILGFPL